MAKFIDFLTKLNSSQIDNCAVKNIGAVKKISERFHREAGIDAPSLTDVNESTFVIEAAHQPNFFPHSGTWKKAFLIDYIRKKTVNSTCFFGYADYNQSTASILYQNKMPAIKKECFASVGFKIEEKDRWKLFNKIEKPTNEEFCAELGRLKQHYGTDYGVIEEAMQDAYKRAGNMADLNAFVFSKICDSWGLKINFFRYSDIQKEGLFIDQWKKIISGLDIYNERYNNALKNRKIEDISPVEEKTLPFWYHCQCSSKAYLEKEGEEISVACPKCNKKYSFPLIELGNFFPDMSATAVARNIVFSEGMGTSLYVSGAGGGLEYGQISEEISGALKFRKPVTVALKGRDYYLGITHKALIRELKRILGADSLSSSEKIIAEIKAKETQIASAIEKTTDKKTVQNNMGQLTNLRNRLAIAKCLFSSNYSFMDQLACLGSEKILPLWARTFDDAQIEQKGFAHIIQGSMILDPEAESLYKTLTSADTYQAALNKAT